MTNVQLKIISPHVLESNDNFICYPLIDISNQNVSEFLTKYFKQFSSVDLNSGRFLEIKNQCLCTDEFKIKL